MSKKRNDHAALTALQQAIDESAVRRRHKPPMHPKVLLKDMMYADHFSKADVVHITKLTRDEVDKLLAGKLYFSEEICDKLSKWTGPRRAKVIRALQVSNDHFSQFGERPSSPRLPDTPDTRETARWYVETKAPKNNPG